MAFFAIVGKAEATRGAGCWSWTIRKAKAAVQLRQALEVLPVMALFAIVGKAEATRGAGCWSWTIRKAEAPV